MSEWAPLKKKVNYMVIGLNIATLPEKSKKKNVWAPLLELCVQGDIYFFFFIEACIYPRKGFSV